MKTRIIIASVIVLILSLLVIITLQKSDGSIETITTTNIVETTESTTTTETSLKTTKKVVKTTQKTTQKTTAKEGTYKLTHYGWNCKGCGGNTASGYNVRNTIHYYDKTYENLRIVAMKDLPLYSVIKIKNYDGRDIFAIVLDRGVGSGVIDLLVESEEKASKLGIRKNIEIEVIRSGK